MDSLLAFSMPGGPEWFFLAIIVILLFGAKKLPELARGLGQSFGEFRKAKDEFEREIQKSTAAPTIPPAPTTPATTAEFVEIKEPADKQPHQPS
jgi:sec-independent protein translocase protein TatA